MPRAQLFPGLGSKFMRRKEQERLIVRHKIKTNQILKSGTIEIRNDNQALYRHQG
jgi:hypothetical protein